MTKRFTESEKWNEEKRLEVPIWERYALSIPEAVQLFGIGEKRMYQLVQENRNADFILEIGSHVKIKREKFARFLDAATTI